jgi:hypothetical protein
MFTLGYDPGRILLSVVQQGYWQIAEFRDFEAQYLAQHRKIRTQCKNYRVFSDCRDFPVQSAEIGEAFAVLFQTLLGENMGRNAIIAATALNKLQARRAIPHRHVEIFASDEIDKAMAWLFADGSLPA